MNTETFNKLLDELDGNSLETLKQKNAKYASADDCLHNFESGAEIMGSTPAQCAWGYLTKHLVALRDMIERDDFSDREDFLEKCQDIINYIRFIWVIGNAQEGYVALDKFEEYLKTPKSDYSCENCAHYSGRQLNHGGYQLIHDCPECHICVSGVDATGKDIYPPSEFVPRETRECNPIEKAYKILVNHRDGKEELYLDEVIGYLGEVLGD